MNVLNVNYAGICHLLNVVFGRVCGNVPLSCDCNKILSASLLMNTESLECDLGLIDKVTSLQVVVSHGA